jgi:hypothetical protein
VFPDDGGWNFSGAPSRPPYFVGESPRLKLTSDFVSFFYINFPFTLILNHERNQTYHRSTIRCIPTMLQVIYVVRHGVSYFSPWWMFGDCDEAAGSATGSSM